MDSPSSSRRRRKRRRQRTKITTWTRGVDWLRDGRLDPLQRLTLVAAIALAVFGIGAVHLPVLVGSSVLASVALLCVALAPREDQRSWIFWAPALVMWVLCLYSALQLIPVPMSVLHAIAPTNADVWARALEPVGGGFRFAPLTLDPGATATEVLRWYTYGAVAGASSQVAQRHGVSWAPKVAFALAVGAALVTLAHGLAGAHRVYGIYEPSFKPVAWHVGPLLNPNNLAGLLNVGVLCGMGIALSDHPSLPRRLAAVGIAMIVAVDVTSGSRGGVGMLVLGLLVLVGAIELLRRRKRFSQELATRSRMLVAAVAALGVALAVLASNRDIVDELFNQDLEKLKTMTMAVPMGRDFWLWGIGRGAFESVFPAYQKANGTTVYTHAENFVAQWGVEWGVAVTVLALLAFGWLLRPRRLGCHSSISALSAWIGILVLALQNLLDLAFEIPAICMVLALLIGGLNGDRKRGSKSRSANRPHGARITGKLAAVGLAVGVLAFPYTWFKARPDLLQERTRLQAAVENASTPRSPETRRALRQLVVAAVTRHPAEPYFPLIGAAVEWEAGERSPLPWVQRALERSAINGKTHYLLARVLKQLGAKRQAMMELRLAAQYDRTMHRAIAETATRWSSKTAELKRVVPPGVHAADLWALLATHAKEPETKAACDKRALELNPLLTQPRERRIVALALAVTSKSGCQGAELAECERQVADDLQWLQRAAPTRAVPIVSEARWLHAIGRTDEALALLEGCNEREDLAYCLRTRVSLLAQAKDPAKFAEAARALRNVACSDRHTCASVNIMIAALHESRGEFGAALSAYEAAIKSNLTLPNLKRLAAAAERAKLTTRAMQAWQRIDRMTPGGDPAAKEAIKRLRADMVRQLDRL